MDPSKMSSETLGDDKSHSSSTEPSYEPLSLIELDEVNTLTQIATQQSRRQSTTGAATHRLASLAAQDPSLNPQCKEFDLQKWILTAMNDVSRDGHEKQKMGIVFKDLNVYGSGAELQFQETVASLFTAPLRIGEAVRKSPSKQILRNFNGLLKSGELLLVLGRPGAGCSTMLKSLCGELHGLNMGDESVIHYNGEFLSHSISPDNWLTRKPRYPPISHDQRIQRRSCIQSRGTVSTPLNLTV